MTSLTICLWMLFGAVGMWFVDSRIRRKRRDQIAMVVLHGILCAPNVSGTKDQLVDAAYSYAEAMLKRGDK